MDVSGLPSSPAPTETPFQRILSAAGVTDTKFARLLNIRARHVHGIDLAVARTTIGHWRHGMRPRSPMVAELAAAQCSEIVGYPVTPADLGWRGETSGPDGLGLTVAGTVPATLAVLAAVSGRDMHPGDGDGGMMFMVGAFSRPALVSLTGTVGQLPDEGHQPGPGGLAVRELAATYRGLASRVGSAQLRGPVAALLHDHAKAGCLAGPGRDLVAALAELAWLAGWLALDCARPATAQRYRVQALALAEHAGDGPLAGHALAAMSEQATWAGYPRHGLELATAAVLRAEGVSTPAARAVLHAARALALAYLGDMAGCERAAGTAAERISQVVAAEEPGWAAHYGAADLAARYGHCLLVLGRPREAAGQLGAAVEACLPVRARCLVLVDLALAHLHGPVVDVEVALAAAGQASGLAVGLGSAAVTGRLAVLDRVLAVHDGVVAVRQWRDRAAGRLAGRQQHTTR